MLTDLRNCGVADVFVVVCDGFTGWPDAVNSVFPLVIVRACVIDLIWATLRYASRKYWDQLARDLKAIYTAASVEAAWGGEFEEKWGKPYPAIPKLWWAAWERFTPFLAYDVEICRVLFSTNAIELLNARYRRAVGARRHFPTEQAASKTPRPNAVIGVRSLYFLGFGFLYACTMRVTKIVAAMIANASTTQRLLM